MSDSDTQRHDASDPATRPADAIEGSAGESWQAFNAMESTKRRHFSLLQRLDLKRTNYGLEPTADEARMLAWLLADHDTQVKRFTAASIALKSSDADAHRQLFDYIALVSAVEGDDSSSPYAH